MLSHQGVERERGAGLDGTAARHGLRLGRRRCGSLRLRRLLRSFRRRGLYRPWFAYDCLRTRPQEQPLPEEVLLPGNVSTVDFSGLPPESLLLLETDLDLPAAQDALLVVSTTADFRAWLDGEPVLGQECGPFVPAFHRTPANQRKALRLAAGVHKLRIGLAPAGEGMASAPIAFGLADPANSAWLPDSIYAR